MINLLKWPRKDSDVSLQSAIQLLHVEIGCWLSTYGRKKKTARAEPTVSCEDNQSTICIAQNPQHHNKTKHIDIKYHYVREKVLDTTIELRYCPTSDMLADILTEGLMYNKFSRLCALSGVKEQSDFKWEGVLENDALLSDC